MCRKCALAFLRACWASPACPSAPRTKKRTHTKNQKARPSKDSDSKPLFSPRHAHAPNPGREAPGKKRNNPAQGFEPPPACTPSPAHPSPWSTDLKSARPKFAYIMILCSECSREDRHFRQKSPMTPLVSQRARSGNFGRIGCQTHLTFYHSSPPYAASVGPSGLDRGSAVRSSVRSHDFSGSQPVIPRRHHCQPPAFFQGVRHAL